MIGTLCKHGRETKIQRTKDNLELLPRLHAAALHRMRSGQLEHEHNLLTMINHVKGHRLGFIALSFIEKATFLRQFISLKMLLTYIWDNTGRI